MLLRLSLSSGASTLPIQSRSAKEGTAMTRTTRHSKRHVLICKASWSKEAERTDAQELRIPHQMLADGTVNSDNQQC